MLSKTCLKFHRLPAAQRQICKPHSCRLCSVHKNFIIEMLHSNLCIIKKMNWVLLGKLFQVGEETRAKLFIIQWYVCRKVIVCFSEKLLYFYFPLQLTDETCMVASVFLASTWQITLNWTVSSVRVTGSCKLAEWIHDEISGLKILIQLHLKPTTVAIINHCL